VERDCGTVWHAMSVSEDMHVIKVNIYPFHVVLRHRRFCCIQL